MSVAFAKKAFDKFITDKTPSVLCIKGNWGVGKAYAWNTAVQTARADSSFAMRKYAYISLFGVKDSADIMQAIYVAAEGSIEQTIADLAPKEVAGRKIEQVGQKLKRLLSFTAEHAAVPHIAGLGGLARAVLTTFVSDTLICIDDLERKSASLTINEIMGVIANLRDARRCKVALILNEDSLDEKEQNELRRYSEKVIDRSVRFMPTEAEAAAIAFPENSTLNSILRIHCKQLGITNIRIMLKIKENAEDLNEIIKDSDQDIKDGVLKSLVVLVWAAFSPPGEGAPTVKYLKDKRGKPSFGKDKTDSSPEEIEWAVTLNDYGFSHCDDLDLIMIDGIENGFYNDERVSTEIRKLMQDASKIRADQALSDAWNLFHESFDNNPDEVATSLYLGCIDNINFLSPTNLSSAFSILEAVGHREKASDLLRRYMEARGGEPIFDLEGDVFGENVKNPEVRAAFREQAKAIAPKMPEPIEAAKKLRAGGWSPQDEASLSSLDVTDFVKIFKSLKGKERRDVIFGCLAFRRISNATPLQSQISDRAHAALEAIGRENPLNAHRLAAYGITPPEGTVEGES